ncbi:MAG: hypothetical protein AAGA48_14405 [Myxococcota bacterium]
MMTLWATVALAGVHKVELDVIAPREPAPTGWAPLGFVAHRIASVRGPDERANVVVDDGYMQVSCAVNTGVLWLHLNWTAPRSWTGRIPQEVDCRVGRHRIRARLRQLPPKYVDPTELQASPDRRAELRLYDNDTPAFQWFALPADVDWVEGEFPWVPDDGAALPTVRCRVGRGNGLRLEVLQATVSASGACVLQDAAGGQLRVPIDLVVCGSLDEVASASSAGCRPRDR